MLLVHLCPSCPPASFLQLCFFAHTPEQLRVTARSLAAQQAQATAGKGKASKGPSKQGSSASTAASNDGSSGDLSALATSPAAEQLLLALCADDGAALSVLLQKLGAGEDTSLDSATTAAMAALQDSSTLARSSSSAAPPETTAVQQAAAAVAAGGSAADASQGSSSPRTPPQHAAVTMPAAEAAAAAQRKDTAPMPSTAAAAQNPGSSTSSGICSVQEHIRNVMQGKVTAEQVQRDTAARALHAAAGVHRSPAIQLPGLAPAHSPAGAHSSLLPAMQGPSPDLLSPGMQTGFLFDGQLCSPQQFLPVGGGGVMGPNSGGMVVSCAGPAQLQQVPGFAADLGAMSGSGISSYGSSGCFLQTAGSIDAVGSFGSSRAAPIMGGGSQCGAMGAVPGLAGPLDALSPVLLQQLSLQGQGAAVGGPGSLIPMLGAPSALPTLGSPGQLPALSAGMPQQQALGAAQYAQQQAAVLMQRQQAAADGLWAGGRQGVGSMLGGGAGADAFGLSTSTFTPCLVGLSG